MSVLVYPREVALGWLFWSAVSALVAAVIGFSLSVPFDLQYGPAIIAISGLLALVAFLVKLAQRR